MDENNLVSNAFWSLESDTTGSQSYTITADNITNIIPMTAGNNTSGVIHFNPGPWVWADPIIFDPVPIGIGSPVNPTFPIPTIVLIPSPIFEKRKMGRCLKPFKKISR
jgi:hypothetical protein